MKNRNRTSRVEISLKVKDILSESQIYNNKKLNWKEYLEVSKFLRRKLG